MNARSDPDGMDLARYLAPHGRAWQVAVVSCHSAPVLLPFGRMCLLLVLIILTVIEASHFVLVLRFEDPPIAQLRFSSERQHELSLRGETVDLHVFLDSLPQIWYGQIETSGGQFSSLELSPRWHKKAKILANVTDTKGNYLRVGYHLECETGFYGSMCTIECIPNDRSTCSSTGTRVCLPGWRGADCSMVDDSCAHSPCFNGECRLTGGDGFFCECKMGFEGMLCDRRVSRYSSGVKTTMTTVTTVTKTTSTVRTSSNQRRSRILSSTSSTTTTTSKTSVVTVVTSESPESRYSNQYLDILIVASVAVFVALGVAIVAVVICLKKKKPSAIHSSATPARCCKSKVSLKPSPDRYTNTPTTSLHRCISPSLPSTAGCISPSPQPLMPFSKAPARYVSQDTIDV